MYWIAVHPLYDLGLGLAVLFLLAGLLKAIARLTERLWLALLQSPLRLGKWLLSRLAQLFKLRLAPEPVPDRLPEILTRLEALRQEQDALLHEAHRLLALASPLQQGSGDYATSDGQRNSSELASRNE
jgi:hypothetical protein